MADKRKGPVEPLSTWQRAMIIAAMSDPSTGVQEQWSLFTQGWLPLAPSLPQKPAASRSMMRRLPRAVRKGVRTLRRFMSFAWRRGLPADSRLQCRSLAGEYFCRPSALAVLAMQ